MTDRLYYHDAFLHQFDAEVTEVRASAGVGQRAAVVLDRTAFYPTSGGQLFDTGWLAPAGHPQQGLQVVEVAEADDDNILHYLEGGAPPSPGTRVQGVIDGERRRDHMQQHSGQHVLSATFLRLFDMPTVSFHMGDQSCTIDLDTRGRALSTEQVEEAERVSNQVITEDRPVEIEFVSLEQARGMGLRKLPALDQEQLRLINIRDFDLTACGGTHVGSTGQIGCILLRKTEKVRQGLRVEFVCGQRAIATARRDYAALSEAAGLYSAQLGDVPQQVRKSLQEAKAAGKARQQALEELAELHGARLLADIPAAGGVGVIVRIFPERDLSFIKLLAQKLTKTEPPGCPGVVALLAATAETPALVFACSPGLPQDMGALMKAALEKLGGRGGGSKDMAEGGPADAGSLQAVLQEIAATIKRR